MDTEHHTKIYVSYPYSDNPEKRLTEVRKIAKQMMKHRNGFVLFIPHFAFHAFNKEFGEETADDHCLELLKSSDVLCICLSQNEPLTRGMNIELKYALNHNMPVFYLEDFVKSPKKVLNEARNLQQAISSPK